MERRQALKNMGLSIGAFALTPTVAGLLQSCSGNSKLSWVPEFYSNEEADIITKTLEIILPPTPEIPGATDLNLAQFLDGYAKNVSGENERLHLKKLIKEYPRTSPLLLPKANDKTDKNNKLDTSGDSNVCCHTTKNLLHSFCHKLLKPTQLMKPNFFISI